MKNFKIVVYILGIFTPLVVCGSSNNQAQRVHDYTGIPRDALIFLRNDLSKKTISSDDYFTGDPTALMLASIFTGQIDADTAWQTFRYRVKTLDEISKIRRDYQRLLPRSEQPYTRTRLLFYCDDEVQVASKLTPLVDPNKVNNIRIFDGNKNRPIWISVNNLVAHLNTISNKDCALFLGQCPRPLFKRIKKHPKFSGVTCHHPDEWVCIHCCMSSSDDE